MNIPKGRFSEEAQELARNGAAVAGMVVLFGIYYRTESLPVIALALAAWWAIALLKPSTGIAMVAFSIPFFWLPKPFGKQNFPVAETMLVLVFTAVLARRLLAAFLPAIAARLRITNYNIEPTTDDGRPTTNDQQLADDNDSKQTKPLGISNPQSAIRNPQSVWLRFLDWNAEDAFAAPAVVMLVLGAFSLLILANPDFAPDSGRAYRWTIVEPVLFYFLITDVIKSRRALLRMLDFFMLAAVLVALYGLWQFLTSTGTIDVEGVQRIVSVYEQPNNLALYLGRAAPLAVCLALFLPWGWRKVAYGLAVLPLAATILLTFSRGAWIGVAIALVVGVGLGLRWQWGWISTTVPRIFRLWLAGVAGAIVLIGLIGLVLFPKLPERILDPGSSLLRFTIWGSALHMGIDHPIFGIGPDQFLNQFQGGYGPCQVINDVVTSTQLGFNECFTSHPHDIFLDYWLTLGIMGLIVLVWLLWRYYRESINLAKWAAAKVGADPLARALALGLIASMTDFLVHGLVDNSYFLMDLALIFWMSCAMVQLLRKRMGIRG